MEDFNLAPKSVYKGKTSDGKEFRVNEYDFGTFSNIEFGKLFLGLLAFGAIAPFVSLIFFIIGIWNFKGRFQLEYPMCIILSSYFLFDAYKGWVVLCLTSIAFNEHQLNWLLAINVGIILASLFLWIFGKTTAECIHNVSSVTLRWVYMLWLFGAAIAIGRMTVNHITSKHPDWVNRNLEIGDYIPEGSTRLRLHD